MTDLTNRLLLKPEEAGEAIGVSRAQAYVLIANGTLPSIKVGSRVRVPVDELRSFISRQLDEQRSQRG